MHAALNSSMSHVPIKLMIAELTKYGPRPALALVRAMRGIVLVPTPSQARKPARGGQTSMKHVPRIKQGEGGNHTDVKASGAGRGQEAGEQW